MKPYQPADLGVLRRAVVVKTLWRANGRSSYPEVLRVQPLLH